MKIHKGDQVLVIAGRERGKVGVVEKVFPDKHRLILTGLNIVKRHTKKSAKNPHGGIIDQPSAMDASNVMLLDANDKKPTRVGFSITSKQKIRVSRRSGAEIVRDTKGGTTK